MASLYIRYPDNTGGGGGGVSSLNGLTGAVNLLAGSGITLTPVGNDITIAATGGSGANTALSNLITTSINQSLLPSTDDTLSLGSASLNWSTLNVHSVGFGGVARINLVGMSLRNTALQTNFDWSGTDPSLVTHKLVDVVDPTNPQDAATKAYVDAAVSSPTGNPNTFAGFDGAGDLYSIGGFNIDTTSGGMNEGLTQQPNNLTGGFTVNNFAVSFDPLQDSPDDNWNIQNYNIQMDVNSSGFTQGTNGNAVQMINGGFSHQGTGDVGALISINLNNSIGNGTDPIVVGGLSYVSAGANIVNNVTLNNQLIGFQFAPGLQSGVIGNYNTTAFSDTANIQGAANNYASFYSAPSIASVSNNNNFTGLNVVPNLTALTGSASYTVINSGGTVTTMGATSNVSGLVFTPNIGTMGATSNFNGVSIGGTITTSHGGINGMIINNQITGGDADYTGIQISPTSGAAIGQVTGVRIQLNNMSDGENPQGVVGLESDSRLSVNASTDLVSGQTFQIGSRIEHLYTVDPGSPVTGTDALAINIAGDMAIQDDVVNGPVGLGLSSVGFIASLGIADTKTVEEITVFLPAASLPDPGFTTGGTIDTMHMVRILPPLPQGGTAVINNLYALHIQGFGGAEFSTSSANAWGLYVEDVDLRNHISGTLNMGSADILLINPDQPMNWWGGNLPLLGVNSDNDQTAFGVLLGSTDTNIAANFTSNVVVSSGANLATGATADVGFVYVVGGSVPDGSAAPGSVNIIGGDGDSADGAAVFIGSGTSNSGDSGDIIIESAAVAAGTGNSGDVIIRSQTSVGGQRGNVITGGGLVLGTSGQAVAAGFTVNSDESYYQLTSAGVVTSDPTTAIVAGRQPGQIIVLENHGSNNIILKNNALTLLPGATDFTMTPNAVISLIWQGATWITMSSSLN